jgi:thiamine biosynthesis lipoprotein
VDHEKTTLKEPSTVMLKEEGMALDLGAIAKGYACDRTAEILKEKGIKHGILDFGGNVYALGTRPDGSPWRVGIKMPIIGESGLVCFLEVSDVSVVTSGGYERYFEKDGVIYHHLLDPKTGYPVSNGLLSVSIVAKSSTYADALSTACFVLGLGDGMKLVTDFGYEGIFVTEDYKIYVTDGLKDVIKILDDRFILA